MELPRIGPDIGVQPGGVVRSSAGASGAVSQNFERLSAQMQSIVEIQDRADRAINFSHGESEYIIGAQQTFDNAAAIQDPAQREATITKNLDFLRDKVIKDHPAAADKLTENLAIRYAGDIDKMKKQTVDLRDKNLAGNLEYTHDAAVQAAATTDDPKLLAETSQNYDDFLSHMTHLNVMSQGAADAKRLKFQDDVAAAKYERIVGKNPDAAMHIGFEESHLPFKVWNAGQEQAHAMIERRNNRGEDMRKADHDAKVRAIWDGSATGAQVSAWNDAGDITDAEYEHYYHHPPSNDGLRQHYIDTIENFSGSAQDLDDYVATNVAGNGKLHESDFKAIAAIHHARREELATDEGRTATESMADITSTLSVTNPEYAGSLLKLPEQVQFAADLKKLHARIKDQPPDVQRKMTKEFMDDFQAKHPPITVTTPAAASGASAESDGMIP